jgi:hypothetical protein
MAPGYVTAGLGTETNCRIDAFGTPRTQRSAGAKDGEHLASQVEPIFGDLIDSLKSAHQTQTAGEMPVGASGAKSQNPTI